MSAEVLEGQSEFSSSRKRRLKCRLSCHAWLGDLQFSHQTSIQSQRNRQRASFQESYGFLGILHGQSTPNESARDEIQFCESFTSSWHEYARVGSLLGHTVIRVSYWLSRYKIGKRYLGTLLFQFGIAITRLWHKSRHNSPRCNQQHWSRCFENERIGEQKSQVSRCVESTLDSDGACHMSSNLIL